MLMIVAKLSIMYIFAGLGWAWLSIITTQPVFICSKLTLETLEQSVKFVQSQQ